MFFKEFLKFFDDLTPFIHTPSILLLRSPYWDCKDKNLFLIRKFYL